MNKYYKKYYKYKGNQGLKVQFVGYQKDSNRYFEGIAKTVEGSLWQVGEFMDDLDITDFEPYTPTPQELSEWGETTTLTNDNPNKVEVSDKDVNLRLECLKLAVAMDNSIRYELSYFTDKADKIYNWLKTTNQKSL